ncbi:hypothetical protein A6U86_34340 [Rhizobium sp. AC27/96]|nr:hypothetical protein A6U86_34340 [Rhizobium sp. AC27/96]
MARFAYQLARLGKVAHWPSSSAAATGSIARTTLIQGFDRLSVLDEIAFLAQFSQLVTRYVVHREAVRLRDQ